MTECISLTTNAKLQINDKDVLLDDSPLNKPESTPRRPLQKLLRNLSDQKDPQAAYRETETECHYRTIPRDRDGSDDDEEDKYENTFYCHDHGEVASCSDDDNHTDDDDGYQDGEFVCYWKHREVGWNDSSQHNISNDCAYRDHETNGEDSSKRWFQRGHNRKNRRRERQEGRWSFGRRRPRDHENNNNEQREEIVLYCAPEGGMNDPNAYDDDDDSSDDCGHVMPSPAQQRSQSPLRFGWRDRENSSNNRENGPRLANLPIIRPFLIGSRRGFSDDPNAINDTNHADDDTTTDHADLPSKHDRDNVIQSISEGITGTPNNTLALDDIPNTSSHPHPPRFLRPFARLLRPQNQQQSTKAAIIQFHKLLRKEDWSLATTMLRSNPLIPRTWHPVQRLYGGRYDGEVLPLHAACALCPPAEFVQELASIYPEALMAKEKSFGRVPLHVACRSLAHSSVLEVLCKMEPKCVVEEDSLNRVALHYLIKNYATLGDDGEDEVVANIIEDDVYEEPVEPTSKDGIVALKMLIEANPKCVHVADHRRWIPLHVACSSSSRRGMTNMIKILLDAWPRSVLCKTSKGSDVFDCVDMAGQYHPTKELVLSILREAREQVQDDASKEDVNEEAKEDEKEEEAEENDLLFQNSYQEDADGKPDDLLIDLEGGNTEESLIEIEDASPKSDAFGEPDGDAMKSEPNEEVSTSESNKDAVESDINETSHESVIDSDDDRAEDNKSTSIAEPEDLDNDFSNSDEFVEPDDVVYEPSRTEKLNWYV